VSFVVPRRSGQSECLFVRLAIAFLGGCASEKLMRSFSPTNGSLNRTRQAPPSCRLPPSALLGYMSGFR
jgi:hypothetical protein